MNTLSAQELFRQLQLLDEQSHIEAKRGSQIGDSVMQTVCAFANEPGLGGGYLLLGVDETSKPDQPFKITGVTNTDQLLDQLSTNCREQFTQPIPVEAKTERLEGKTVISVFIPELEPAAKPCTFKGKFNSKNKRKTGIWRRGLNGDFECTQVELEPLLIAKSGLGFEQITLPDATLDDLAQDAIELYRTLRARVRPHAEELDATNTEMLHALNLIRKKDQHWAPNIAGLLLLGKPLSLKRLLPMVRVDYVRIAGTQWVEDPDQRFVTTLDFREPLIRLIPKLEATILDDLPKHFRLKEGDIQRSDQPLLPQKVIREAIVNALMHRDYQVNQPILIVRYSNRIEIRNAGYSLKPEEMLGEMGSKLRNPILANVLYDLNFAETKGSGIRTMRRLLNNAGLAAPVFTSNIIANEFLATYLLHQLLDEEQLSWLKQFSHLKLSDDEARALILAKETGVISNAALRAVTDLDTLAASEVLKRLHHHFSLLQKSGAGPATFYRLKTPLSDTTELPLFRNTGDSNSNTGDSNSNTGDSNSNTGDSNSNTGDSNSNTGDSNSNTDELPEALSAMIQQLTPKARKNKLWPVILWLCALKPQKAEQLASLLGNRQVNALKSGHLNKLRTEQGLLTLLHPEQNHPEQAYQTTEKGRRWLEEHGLSIK